MKRVLMAIGAVGLALLIAGCGSTIQQRAYAAGQTYSVLQSGALATIKILSPAGQPVSDAHLATIDRIAEADAKVSPQVQAALKCAEDLQRAEEGPDEEDAQAAALGLSASEVAEAQADACEAALSRVNAGIEFVNKALE